MIEVSIDSIVGESPFDVYLCDSEGDNCVWVGHTGDTSFSFFVPPPYDEMEELTIMVVDGNGCEIIVQETVEE